MSTENKKIKGATIVEYKGIQFKSKLERDFYIILEGSGLYFKYEPEVIKIVDSYKLNNLKVFLPEKKSKTNKGRKNLRILTTKLLPVTYKPDFVIRNGDYTIYLEAKGRSNDIYPLKRKLLLEYLDENTEDTAFIEVHNKYQLHQAIEIIKNLEMNELNKIKEDLVFLKEKDIPHAKDLVEKRDFESLVYVVKANILYVEELINDVPLEDRDYWNVILERLRDLKQMIYEYASEIDPDFMSYE